MMNDKSLANSALIVIDSLFHKLKFKTLHTLERYWLVVSKSIAAKLFILIPCAM